MIHLGAMLPHEVHVGREELLEQIKQQMYREMFNLPRNMIFEIMLKYQFALKTNVFETDLGRAYLALCCLCYSSVLESRTKQKQKSYSHLVDHNHFSVLFEISLYCVSVLLTPGRCLSSGPRHLLP